MGEAVKRICAWICALLVLAGCAGARAEFSPRLDALEAGGGASLEIRARLESAAGLSASSLAAVNGLLSRMAARAERRQDATGSLSQIAVTLDGQRWLAASVEEKDNETLTVFFPSGGAYLTSPDAPDALALLAGEREYPLRVSALADVYPAAAGKLYAALEARTAGKTKKSATTVKYASASASYVLYSLTEEEMNAFWPVLWPLLLPAAEAALADQPLTLIRLKALLPRITFSGKSEFKRLLDKNGADMGMQFTGRAGADGDVRKVTLFGGFTAGRGGYFSLSLPAVSGKNSLKLQWGEQLITAKNGSRTLTAEGTYNRNLNGVRTAAVLSATLKNAVQAEEEHWTGKATVTLTENRSTAAYTLTPDLRFTDGGLHGTVTIRKKESDAIVMKAAAEISLTPPAAADAPGAQDPKDLTGMEPARARAAVQEEMTALTRAFARLMAGLPESDRVLLTHELRTDSWMTAPAAAWDAPKADQQEEEITENERGEYEVDETLEEGME